MGTNFATYLTDARIENAKRLLCDVTLNIGEVASTAGFDDPRYFARRFKQKTGSTPRAWRELQGRGA
jgi:two-component system response regulator YesN